MANIFDIVGMTEERRRKDLDEKVILIRQEQAKVATYSDEKLKEASINLKIYLRDILDGRNLSGKNPNFNQYSTEQALASITNEAYALALEAVRRVKKFDLHDTQIQGGLVLKDKSIAEMATGEGKTLTAVLPAYLHALTGEGVHVYVPNDYLASRDHEETKEIYAKLGLSSGLLVNEGEADINGKRRKVTREESEAIKKSAYNCDITYGSDATFVFDNSRDCVQVNKENILNKRPTRGFALVDEADSIFLDRAQTPYVLSGTSEAKERYIGKEQLIKEQEEEQKYKLMQAENANEAVKGIYFKHLEAIRQKKISPIEIALTPEQYEIKTGAKNKYEFEKCIVFNRKDKDFHLTELGYQYVSKYYIGKEINEIFSTEFYNLSPESRKRYKENEDYIIESITDTRTGEKLPYLKLTESGYLKVLNNQEIKEINQRYNDFMTFEFNAKDSLFVNNAIRAYFLMSENEDYVLDQIVNPKTGEVVPNTRKVATLNNGRIAQNSVFSNGLHLAIELKEQSIADNMGMKLNITKTEEQKEIMSITMPAFMGMYRNVSGMTGTSSPFLKDIYGLDTVKIERNFEYLKRKETNSKYRPNKYEKDGSVYVGNRLDRPEELYETEEAKINRIVEEILISHQKGQPVLISTTSVEESYIIKNALTSRIKDTKINVLNAQTKEENNIIKRAGEPGSITVSTEMAGRGTDIKLGYNEEVLVEDLKLGRRKEIFEEYIKEVLECNKNNPKISGEQLEKDMRSLMKLYPEIVAENMAKTYSRRVKDSGGLKVVGCGHFTSKRVDDQVRGRAARQGEVGETIFISSINDLSRIGIKKADSTKLLKNGVAKGEDVFDLIQDCQNIHDSLQATSIIEENKKSLIQEIYRQDYQNQRNILIERDYYEQSMEYMIGQTARRTLKELSAKKTLKERTKLSRMKIRKSDVKEAAKENFGITITDEDLKKVQRAGGLLELLETKAIMKFREDMKKPNAKENLKVLVDGMMIEAWDDFKLQYDRLKKYQFLKQYANQNPQSLQEDFEVDLYNSYNTIFKEARANITAKCLTGKKYKSFKDEVKESEYTKYQQEEFANIERREKQYFAEKKQRKTKEGREKFFDKIKVNYTAFMANINNKFSFKGSKKVVGVKSNNGQNSDVETIDFESGPIRR